MKVGGATKRTRFRRLGEGIQVDIFIVLLATQCDRIRCRNTTFHDHVTLVRVPRRRRERGKFERHSCVSRDRIGHWEPGNCSSQDRPVHGHQYKRRQRHVRGAIKAVRVIPTLNKPRTLADLRVSLGGVRHKLRGMTLRFQESTCSNFLPKDPRYDHDQSEALTRWIEYSYPLSCQGPHGVTERTIA